MTTTLTLNLPDSFAQALAAKHPSGLEAAAAVALKAYLTGGRPIINKDRDTEIVHLILDGKRRADIAKQYNLSIVRINQIAAEHNATKPRQRGPRLTPEQQAAKQRLLQEWA